MYIRKLLLISKLALALLLCYVITKTVIEPAQPEEIFTPQPAAGIQDIGTTQMTTQQEVSVKDYSAIIEHNIFSGSGPSPAANESPLNNKTGAQLQLARHDLGLVLLGTICGSEVVSRAVIKDTRGNETGLYRIGDTVADATVENIEKDAVYLLHNGRIKLLRLYSPDGQEHQVTSRRAGQPKSEAANTSLPVKQDLEEVKTKAGHIETMLRKAVIEPCEADGQMEGLKITGLEKVPIAKGLGLKNGDVIRSVNGQRLTSKQKAFQVFMKARTQPTIDIELLRDRKSKKLSFVLR